MTVFVLLMTCFSTRSKLIQKSVDTLTARPRTQDHIIHSPYLFYFISRPCNFISLWCLVSLDGYNLNPVIHLVLQLIIGPGHGLLHIVSGITIDLSYFGKRDNCGFFLEESIMKYQYF